MPKKAQRSIPSGEWGSQVSKYPADSDLVNLNDLTADSKNYDTHEKGVLTKRKGSVQYSTLSNPAADQYEAIFSDRTRHLITVQNGAVEHSTGDGVTNSVVNGAGFSTAGNFEFATITDRIYMGNGINAGQVYDKTAVYGGAAPATVPRLKAMGCQIPSTPCVAAVGAGGNVPAVGHKYKVTYMYYELEESNGNTASNLVTPGIPSIVNLTSVPIGGYGVTSRKIYRDDNDGLYRLVGEVSDNTTTIFADNAAVGTATIPEENEIPPVFGQITNFLDRAWISDIVGEPHTIRHSEAGLPNIYRSTNFVVCNERDPITTHITFLDRTVVFNRNSMGQILGKTSDTFRYAEIQSSVGCVDSRTVQTRIIRGVPHLVWLSDKGIYAYNGNSIEYISEPIEDLVNFNIQQGVQTKGQNSQTSQSDFQAGTASGGIDLTSDPGAITTPEPSRLWNDQTDWEGGSIETNVSTKETSNKLQQPIQFDPVLSEGSLANLEIVGSDLKIITTDVFTGEDHFNAGTTQYFVASSNEAGVVATAVAQPVAPTKGGYLTSFNTVQISFSAGFTHFRRKVWRDNVGSPGTPGTEIYSGSRSNIVPIPPSPNVQFITGETVNIRVEAGEKIWIGAEYEELDINSGLNMNNGTLFDGQLKVKVGGSWEARGNFYLNMQYSFNSDISATSGQWLSVINNTKSDSVSTTLNIAHSASYPAGTSATTAVEGSDNEFFSGGAEVSESVVSLNGNQNLAISGKRYWRIRTQLETTNDTITPTVNTPNLKYDVDATWESETIDCTADVTAYNSLDIVKTEPTGTTVVMKVATSADDIVYPDGFVTFGTEVVRRYIKVQLVLNNSGDRTVTADIISVNLKWTIVANLISSQINTGDTPAGWDIFQETSTLNGGTLVFEMRSATAPGGLGGATWYAVTNGAFPTTSLPVEQYIQWRTTITSIAGNVPEVAAVVINWLVSSSDPIRAASLFYDKHYYLAAARFGSTVNDIGVILDPAGKWRIWEDININTISLFFNVPYYGDANAGKILKMFEGNLDLGSTNIPLDVRMKADDFSDKYTDNRDKQKVMRDVVITGKNTGATYTFYYSIDVGTTWTALKDDTGATSFTTLSDNGRFTKRFKADHSQSSPITGRTIMIRATSNDANDVELHKFKVRAFIRKGEPLG